MLPRVFAATIVLTWALSASSAMAQQVQQVAPPPYDAIITFSVPVNLTQLSPDIEKVRVMCFIQSAALVLPPANSYSAELAPKDERYVVGGKVQTTMQVVVPIPTGSLPNAVGKTATYSCALSGFSKSQQASGAFLESSGPEFKITPPPQVLTGTFTW